MKEFREGLRQQIIDVSDLKCFWGTAGGMATIYGAMYREIGDGNITNDDREQIADWIRTQRIDCTATFGKPESIDTYDLKRELTDMIFEVRNLTDEDRSKGRSYRDSLHERMIAAGWKPVDPT